MHRTLVAVVILLAGCAPAYDPPVTGDHGSVKYQTDLVRCRKQASTAASKLANATPQSAVAALFNSGEKQRQDVVACMQARGYQPRGA